MGNLAATTVILAMATTAAFGNHRSQFRHHLPALRASETSAEMRARKRSDLASYRALRLQQVSLRPSVEQRLGGDGAIASLGYHPSVVAATLRPEELDGAAQAQLGHSESSAGALVRIPF